MAKNIFDLIESGEMTDEEIKNFSGNVGDTLSAKEQTSFESDGSGGFFIPAGSVAEGEALVQQGIDDRLQQSDDDGILGSISEAFTGAKRSTKEIDSISEIGVATPELRSLDGGSLKSIAGLLTTGDTSKLKKIFKQQLPDAKFRKDRKGNDIIDLPSGSYALNKPGLSGGDIARGIFDVLAFNPVGRAASLATSAVARTAIGAAGSAAVETGLQATSQAVGGGPIDQKQVFLAGALGGAGQAVGEAIGAVSRGTRGTINTEQQAVIDAGRGQGVDILTSDIVEGAASATADRVGSGITLFGTGGRREAQQAQRQQAIKKLLEETPTTSDADIFNSLQRNANKTKRAAGAVTGRISTQMDEAGDVPLDNINRQLNESLTKLQGVRGQKDQGSIDLLTDLKASLQPREGGAGFKFSELRQQRTTSREIFESVDDRGRSQLRSSSKVEADKVMRSITSTLDNFVSQAGNARILRQYKNADRVTRQEALQLSRTKLKRVLDGGEVTPERVNSLLFSNNKSEAKILFSKLDTQGKANARSSIIHQSVKKATVNGEINPNLLAKQLDKLEANVNIFFRGDDRKRIDGLKKLLRATSKAQDSNVSQQVIGGVTASGVAATSGIVPALVAAATIGGAARIYESKPVRDMLLKLSNTSRNDLKFNRIIDKAMPQINAVLQNARREQEVDNGQR
jgi:hypothetical protein